MDKVCIVGLGYVGLPTASILANHGCDVLGVDVSPETVETINNGSVHIEKPGLETLVRAAINSRSYESCPTMSCRNCEKSANVLSDQRRPGSLVPGFSAIHLAFHSLKGELA